MKVPLGARRAVRQGHFRIPGDPPQAAVAGRVTLVDTPRYEFRTYPSHRSWLVLTTRNVLIISPGYRAARDQGWLWNSEMPRPGVLTVQWTEEDGVAGVVLEGADPARAAAFLDRLRRGHRDRIDLFNASERREREVWGALGTFREQALRDTQHYVVRWRLNTKSGVVIHRYWKGPMCLRPGMPLDSTGHGFGGLRTAWRSSDRHTADFALADLRGLEPAYDMAVLTVADSQKDEDQQT